MDPGKVTVFVTEYLSEMPFAAKKICERTKPQCISKEHGKENNIFEKLAPDDEATSARPSTLGTNCDENGPKSSASNNKSESVSGLVEDKVKSINTQLSHDNTEEKLCLADNNANDVKDIDFDIADSEHQNITMISTQSVNTEDDNALEHDIIGDWQHCKNVLNENQISLPSSDQNDGLHCAGVSTKRAGDLGSNQSSMTDLLLEIGCGQTINKITTDCVITIDKMLSILEAQAQFGVENGDVVVSPNQLPSCLSNDGKSGPFGFGNRYSDSADEVIDEAASKFTLDKILQILESNENKEVCDSRKDSDGVVQMQSLREDVMPECEVSHHTGTNSLEDKDNGCSRCTVADAVSKGSCEVTQPRCESDEEIKMKCATTIDEIVCILELEDDIGNDADETQIDNCELEGISYRSLPSQAPRHRERQSIAQEYILSECRITLDKIVKILELANIASECHEVDIDHDKTTACSIKAIKNTLEDDFDDCDDVDVRPSNGVSVLPPSESTYLETGCDSTTTSSHVTRTTIARVDPANEAIVPHPIYEPISPPGPPNAVSIESASHLKTKVPTLCSILVLGKLVSPGLDEAELKKQADKAFLKELWQEGSGRLVLNSNDDGKESNQKDGRRNILRPEKRSSFDSVEYRTPLKGNLASNYCRSTNATIPQQFRNYTNNQPLLKSLLEETDMANTAMLYRTMQQRCENSRGICSCVTIERQFHPIPPHGGNRGSIRSTGEARGNYFGRTHYIDRDYSLHTTAVEPLPIEKSHSSCNEPPLRKFASILTSDKTDISRNYHFEKLRDISNKNGFHRISSPQSNGHQKRVRAAETINW